MLLEVILPISLLAPGAAIQMNLTHKLTSTIERFVLSYTFSLVLLFGVLYIGAITFSFYLSSLLILVIALGSTIYLLFSYLIHSTMENPLSKISKSEMVGILSIGSLIFVCIAVLSLRPILDSDVAQFYLPIAREIARSNGFSYSTGFDYNILLKPMGVSVLYAWVYAIDGSLISEAFRLLPVIPLLVMSGCVYTIAKEVTQSKEAAILSMIVFAVIPFQDRFLLYNAFYPDTFYYPLIFTSILFTIKYTKNHDWRYLLYTGIALGVGGLLKAQTIYFVIAMLAIIFFFDSGWNRFNLVVCAIVPFTILLPNLLIETIRGRGLFLSLEGLSVETLPLFLFLSIVLVVAYLGLSRLGFNPGYTDSTGLKRVISRGLIVIIPVLLISSLWYVTNLLRFGSLISTSSIDLPNYEWALDIIDSTNPTPPSINLSNYFVFFGFMFLDPAVLGYIWSVVLFVGCYVFVKLKTDGLGTLAMISLLFATILFSQVIYTIPSVGVPTYNPRDIFVLAPILCILASIGILHLTQMKEESLSNRDSIGWTSLGLVAFYGFLGYIHSVVMWFANLFSPTSLPSNLFASLTSIFGLTLRDTSFQISATDRVPFPLENASSIVLLSIVGGIPILVLLVSKTRIREYLQNLMNIDLVSFFRRKIGILESRKTLELILKSFLILAVILGPRGVLFFQGGILSVTSSSLESTYSGLQDLGEYDVGGILTYRAPDGLPYYLPENQIIDFRWAANIAALKDTLTLDNPIEVAEGLRDKGITHLLLNPILIGGLDIVLNNTFSKLTSDIALTYVVHTFRGWVLYKLGPFSVERTIYSSLTWNISSRWTNASYSLSTNETGVHLGLYPNRDTSRVTIFSEDLPNLLLSDYDLVHVNVSGSSNARILVRLFLNDSSGLDIAYWIDPVQTNNAMVSLASFGDRMLGGDIFIGLVSSDGEPSNISFIEITFIKLNIFS